ATPPDFGTPRAAAQRDPPDPSLPPPVRAPAPPAVPDSKQTNVAALPPLPTPTDPKVPARELFARKLEPAHLPSRVIGGYADGCLAGAQALPTTGPTRKVMRLSGKRQWGHPVLILLVERYAT